MFCPQMSVEEKPPHAPLWTGHARWRLWHNPVKTVGHEEDKSNMKYRAGGDLLCWSLDSCEEHWPKSVALTQQRVGLVSLHKDLRGRSSDAEPPQYLWTPGEAWAFPSCFFIILVSENSSFPSCQLVVSGSWTVCLLLSAELSIELHMSTRVVRGGEPGGGRRTSGTSTQSNKEPSFSR